MDLFERGGLLVDCGEDAMGQLARRYGGAGAAARLEELALVWVSGVQGWGAGVGAGVGAGKWSGRLGGMAGRRSLEWGGGLSTRASINAPNSLPCEAFRRLARNSTCWSAIPAAGPAAPPPLLPLAYHLLGYTLRVAPLSPPAR